MPSHVRLRALLIVLGALAATSMPTIAAFAEPPRVPATQQHSTPREEIQPAAHIFGELARKTAQRTSKKPLGLVPDRPDRTPKRMHHVAPHGSATR
ncbi:hypothetical protein [Streptomyces sp. NPDC048436]|uniref:hypothetical protein n=1 Tax=Streptomyces sp. NPDC048436 TaxID=3365550 RepID=UPI00371D60F7